MRLWEVFGWHFAAQQVAGMCPGLGTLNLDRALGADESVRARSEPSVVGKTEAAVGHFDVLLHRVEPSCFRLAHAPPTHRSVGRVFDAVLGDHAEALADEVGNEAVDLGRQFPRLRGEDLVEAAGGRNAFSEFKPL